MLLCTLTLTFIAMCYAGLSSVNITLVTYGSPRTTFIFGLPYTAPAYKLAVAEIRKDFGLNIKHSFIEQDAIQSCEDLADYSYLVAQYYFHRRDPNNLFVLTTPGCDDLVPLAQLSREWNTLILSSGVAFPTTLHQAFYPTAVSFSAVNFAAWAQTFAEIFKKFSWTSISFIYDRWGHNSVYHLLIDSLKRNLDGQRNLSVPIVYKNLFYPVDTRAAVSEAEMSEALKRARNVSRVILLAFQASETRRFMIMASKLNMTNSDYVYFAIEPFRNAEFFGTLKASYDDGNYETAKDAFKVLFQVTGSCSKYVNASGLRRVVDDIKHRSAIGYGVRYSADEEPSEIVLSSYFAIKFFGVMLSKAFADSVDIYNGTLLAKTFLNKTEYITNQSITIDYSGDRVKDICIQSYNATTDKFEKVMYYDPSLTTLAEQNGGIVWKNGKPPPNEPSCGYKGEGCPEQQSNIATTLGIAVPIIIFMIAIAMLIAWKVRKEYNLKDDWWKVDKGDLIVPEVLKGGMSKQSAFSLSTMGNDPKHIRRIRGNVVWVKKIAVTRNLILDRPTRLLLREIKLIAHGNIAELIGICMEANFLHFVYEFCGKGSLYHLLEKINLDWEFRAALINDLIEGIIVIHGSVFKRHGYLNPHTCLIDKHFTLKLSEFGLYDLTKNIAAPKQEASRHGTLSFTNVERWIPPELMYLQSEYFDIRMLASVAGPDADIYALGGIMDAVLEESISSSLNENGQVRTMGPETQRLIAACQRSNAATRPTIEEVKRRFHERAGTKTGGFVDSLIRRMQKYARKLEFAVRDRTDALNAERKLCEKLLVEMLPKVIVEKLLAGCAIEPEHFYGVTIFFSLIVKFVEFVATHSPLQVVAFLNNLFTTFDDALSMYNVYKVETISDCYMVVSGMPIPNGNQHAGEICRMSLQLLALFKHSADQYNMQLKIGINSGSCAAGVIGSKRPRYCLFGDTVNTASRLASHGEPSKIHISTATSALIMYCPEFKVVERGVVELKGKGKERTFWLEAAN
ncbi:atrial natriuretic peptide receptor 1-like [Paramacrobiotus metropolitanus]|uniref:atrial natriuretic peptide receptor 1-like n=1 Tax=Paramacrobiotus metropolitanus TaxID=2943436 RepID=UPI002445FA32|nr:atrial natriuretic peptide receptor 1-like [Paramacrobiotus metropolitanus]